MARYSWDVRPFPECIVIAFSAGRVNFLADHRSCLLFVDALVGQGDNEQRAAARHGTKDHRSPR
jgi:hypothetical protein